MAHNSAPSSPEDVLDVRPWVDTRPEILVLSSAIRDGLNHAMQPVNSTLESLTKTVVALQRKLLPPSHYGLGSGAIDVAAPPSAFRRHRSPVSRERIGLGAAYILCVRYIPVPTHPVNGKAWKCILLLHQSVKFGDKYRKNIGNAGQY